MSIVMCYRILHFHEVSSWNFHLGNKNVVEPLIFTLGKNTHQFGEVVENIQVKIMSRNMFNPFQYSNYVSFTFLCLLHLLQHTTFASSGIRFNFFYGCE